MITQILVSAQYAPRLRRLTTLRSVRRCRKYSNWWFLSHVSLLPIIRLNNPVRQPDRAVNSSGFPDCFPQMFLMGLKPMASRFRAAKTESSTTSQKPGPGTRRHLNTFANTFAENLPSCGGNWQNAAPATVEKQAPPP